jgi:large subunit ribosomal protein L13
MDDKTFSPKSQDRQHEWYLVDAQGKTLGRLATEIARVLKGKHKPTYAPHVDMGDHIVVINAEKIKVTGNKASQKVYYRHTGHHGGLRETPYERMLEKHPERILQKAVWGMLPHNILGRNMFKKLRVYAGGDHPHHAQQPQQPPAHLAL